MRLARLVLALLFAATAFSRPYAAHAEARHAAMVIDANSGQVLHSQAGDEPRYPASLTKMMTLYMAFELIDSGRLNYATKLKVSQEAASAAPSKLDLDPGEEIQLIDAIKALVTKSANDVAIVIAEHIGGTEANFARMMTAKARQIGMPNTTFRNASGLPDTGQITTARDMLTLALRLQDNFPRHYALFATRTFTFNGGTHRNHNTLLGTFAGIDGIKTGYTRASGFNLVSSVRRDGRHVVAAVFGGSSAASRNAHMRVLLNRALAKASTEKTRKPMLVAKPRLAPRPEPKVAASATPKPVIVANSEKSASAKPAPLAKPAAEREPSLPAPATSAAIATPDTTATSDDISDRQAQVVSVAAPVEPEPASPPIEIAKVRRVMVAPRPKPPRQFALTETTEEPAEVEPRAAVEGQTTSAPNPDQPLGATETIFSKSPRPAAAPSRIAAAPDTPSAQNRIEAERALAGERPVPAPTPSPLPIVQAEPPATAVRARPPKAVAVSQPVGPPPLIATAPQKASVATNTAAPPVRPPVRTYVPARPPSTLQQQAQNLGTTTTPAMPVRVAQAVDPAGGDAWRLNGPPRTNLKSAGISAGAASSGGGFQIQVGAYGTAAESERQLASIRSRATAVVGSKAGVSLPVQKGDRQMFRARFAGFDANAAASACSELRRLAIDCFVMKAE